jgi:hypothetical protein
MCSVTGNTPNFVLLSKAMKTACNMCHNSDHLQYFCDLCIVEEMLPKICRQNHMSAAKFQTNTL